MHTPEDAPGPLRVRLRRALLAQAEEIERLEQAVRDLRSRQDELEDVFEQALAASQDAEERGGAATVGPGDTADPGGLPRPQAGVDELPDEPVLRDARRFARLLVSEIALYHPAEVEKGRQAGDLYGRLKSSIDHSRQVYQNRFGRTAAGRFDFFHEELVRNLAASNPALLGLGYPGSSA